MPLSGDSGRKREITYNAGWKKGKIKVGDRTEPDRVQADSADDPHEAPQSRLLAQIWSPTPFVSARHALLLLWSLPAIGFVLILWLVYTLVRL